MGVQCGIVGLPNVGKSTLFNALSNAGVDASNYPFCTIEPNVGVVLVPDPRLHHLAAMADSDEKVPASIEFVDIAGLVEGASRGEGLGNQFLAQIREVDAIIHVVRCFQDDQVSHYSGSVDAVRDVEVINTELLLKDMETVQRRLEKARKPASSGVEEAQEALDFFERLHAHLDEGAPARLFDVDPSDQERYDELFLLTDKPVLYVANVSEDDLPDGNEEVRRLRSHVEGEEARVIVLSAEFEAQLAELDQDQQEMFLEEYNLEEPSLNRLIHAAYDLLGMITFFSATPKETRAWTIPRGTLAPEAAGTIHSDFEQGFICAEAIPYEEYAKHGSEKAARDAGAIRTEGKNYEVKEGDVIYFRFNV